MATPKEQHDARAHAITTGADQPAATLPVGAAHAGGTHREPLSEDETVREALQAGHGQHTEPAESIPADPSVCSSDEP